ncbi:MAG: sel1 repeat family protein [Proteobacteria bacterium]|nr:sel1 repeat family protein [Pseudomonadota bacterium]
MTRKIIVLSAIIFVALAGFVLLSPQKSYAKDEKVAISKIRNAVQKAAEQGDAEAQTTLGGMYENGSFGIAQDYAEAVKWWQKAAEQGYAMAQHNLGVSYAQGLGVPLDDREAVKWCRKAAEQGYVPAKLFLRKAAEQGHVYAQLALGTMYSYGRGVEQDYTEAYFWLHLAAEQNSDHSEVRDIAAKKLSPDVLATTQKRGREWRPKTAELPDQ